MTPTVLVGGKLGKRFLWSGGRGVSTGGGADAAKAGSHSAVGDHPTQFPEGGSPPAAPNVTPTTARSSSPAQMKERGGEALLPGEGQDTCLGWPAQRPPTPSPGKW